MLRRTQINWLSATRVLVTSAPCVPDYSYYHCQQNRLYKLYMNIPSPKAKTDHEESSVQDAFFHIESQLLLTSHLPKNPQKYKLNYSKSFNPIITANILKKTLNTSWTERYFVLTSTRLLYYSDKSMNVLKGCFVLASLIEYDLNIKAEHPEIR